VRSRESYFEESARPYESCKAREARSRGYCSFFLAPLALPSLALPCKLRKARETRTAKTNQEKHAVLLLPCLANFARQEKRGRKETYILHKRPIFNKFANFARQEKRGRKDKAKRSEDGEDG